MSIIGSLQDLSLADIIQVVAGSQKSGILYVNTDEGRSTIVFKNGFVVSASKPDLTSRLGQLLRKQNGISQAELEMCLGEQHQTGRPLGEILLERLLVTREQLQTLMRIQVMETLNEIVNLGEGSFSFHSDIQLPTDQISFDAQHLLLDVAFLQDTTRRQQKPVEEDGFSPQRLIAGMDDEVSGGGLERRDRAAPAAAVSLLRELADELARPSESTEVSLLVLRLAAACFDRCLFFVVKDDSLVGCGGFGFPLQSEAPGPEGARTVVPLVAASIFKTVYETRKAYQGSLLEGSWGRDLMEKLSPRLPSEVAVLPIICQEEVIALLYGDNGEGQASLPATDLLEVLLLQAGMALENKRLRDKLLRLTSSVAV